SAPPPRRRFGRRPACRARAWDGGGRRLTRRRRPRMRIPLASGAWLDYGATWLSPDEADEALSALRDELTWEQREIVLFGRRILQPRFIAWAGDLGYRYSGQTLEPRAFTPT